MTVRKMIALLKKMPQNAQVVVCDHDQDPERGEFSGVPNWVVEAPPAIKARGYGVVIG